VPRVGKFPTLAHVSHSSFTVRANSIISSGFSSILLISSLALALPARALHRFRLNFIALFGTGGTHFSSALGLRRLSSLLLFDASPWAGLFLRSSPGIAHPWRTHRPTRQRLSWARTQRNMSVTRPLEDLLDKKSQLAGVVESACLVNPVVETAEYAVKVRQPFFRAP
jgi:hypothetical protein